LTRSASVTNNWISGTTSVRFLPGAGEWGSVVDLGSPLDVGG